MHDMKNIAILSTACGAMFMPGFLQCLKANGERNIRIIGADISGDCEAMGFLVDKYYKVPPYSNPEYVDCLIDICQRENVDIFFPHISMELPYVSARIADFQSRNIMVAITDAGTLKLANNKFRLYEFLKSKGLCVPEYFLIKSADELRYRANDLGYPRQPVVVKMTENSGSRGVRIIKAGLSKSKLFMNSKPSSMYISLDEMCAIIDDCNPVPELMAMRYIPGEEYTVDLLADKGRTVYIAGRRNTASSLSIAQASVVEMKDDAYLMCSRIVSELGLDGNIGFDFMLDENDRPWLTDLNPRITATIIIYAAAGLNLPYLRVKQMLGEPLPTIDIAYGTKLIRKYRDILYFDNKLITL